MRQVVQSDEPTVPEVVYRDPFIPVLKNSPSLHVTAEQNEYIRDILKIACSDSKFAEKAYVAIALVLVGTPVAPVVSNLVPSTINLGEPSFDIHVMGTGFNPYSKIIFNGYEEPTTYISDTELTTGINMPLWQAPAVVPVAVRNGDLQSDTVEFSFTDPTVLSLTTPSPSHLVKEHKKIEIPEKKIEMPEKDRSRR